jgi:Right handed beta helix region
MRRAPAALLLIVAAAAVLGLAAAAAPAKTPKPRSILVGSEKAFTRAAKKLAGTGGRIVLRPRLYGRLVIGPRSGGRLRVEGLRGTRVQTILLNGAGNVTLSGIRIGPISGDAGIDLMGARNIVLEDLVVSAKGTSRSAAIFLRYARHVVIRDSTFTHCGDFSPHFVNCITLNRGAHNVRIVNNRFHDCRGCDFIHGRFGSWLTIVGNRFDRALPCHFGRYRCGHNDLVQLFAGQNLRVERNRFGVYRSGGAQLYLTNDVDYATIVNNLFVGTDPKMPGYRARMAIVIGSNESERLPEYAKVLNNTILTGWERKDGYAGSLRMSSRYGAFPRWKRPIVANNVIALLQTAWRVCAASQRFLQNIVIDGKNCTATYDPGPPELDARGRPLPDSPVIDLANRHYAPRDDATGKRRDGRPDIGAFEYRNGG